MIETFLEWNVEWGRLTMIVCWMKMKDWDIFEVTCLNEALLNDSKWRIVYDTIVNDTYFVNESESYWCDMLDDTRRMNAMNFEWCKFEWCKFEWCKFEWLYEYWNDILLNE